MGNLVIKGHGKDAGDKASFFTISVVVGIIGIILVFVIVNAASDYHPAGPWPQMTYGIRIGDIVFAANLVIATLSILIAINIIRDIVRSNNRYKSEVSVFEYGISGVSETNEAFELKYDQITSVHSQEENAWKSVNINAGGKVFKVNTYKCVEIAAEINARIQQQNSANTGTAAPAQVSENDPITRRAFLLIEDGDWEKADELFEQALNNNPENSKAYIGKLLAELRLNSEDELKNSSAPTIKESNYFKKALRFADDNYRKKLQSYVFTPEELNDIENDMSYQKLLHLIEERKNTTDSREAQKIDKEIMQIVDDIAGYKDVQKIRKELQEIIENEKEMSYQKLLQLVEEVKNTTNTREALKIDKEIMQIVDDIADYKDVQKIRKEMNAPIAISEDSIVCPACNKEQGNYRADCWNCGVKFFS